MKLVERYHRNAQDRFRNYTGRTPQNAQPRIGKLGAFERTLTFNVTLIDNALPGKATLFGATWDLSETTNTANNVLVTVTESSHTQVKSSLMQSPITVGRWQLQSSNAAQLATIWAMSEKNSFGKKITTPVQPLTYQDPSDNRTDMVIIRDAPQTIAKDTGIEIDLLAGQSFILVAMVTATLDISGVLTDTPIKKEI